MNRNSPKATVYLSPPIMRALQAVPTQSLSGRLADICERYMTICDAVLRRTHFQPGEIEAIRQAIGEHGGIEDAWLVRRPEMARFGVAERVAIIEQMDREQSKKGEAK